MNSEFQLVFCACGMENRFMLCNIELQVFQISNLVESIKYRKITMIEGKKPSWKRKR